MRRGARFILLTGAALAALASCGGGDDDDGATDQGDGTLGPSSQYEALCQTPRSGDDPLTGIAFPDKQGSFDDEKNWLRAWTDELYLWYREVPVNDPADYATPIDYFDVLKTPATTASGKPKDQFHFIYATDVWEALSQSGVSAGYGATFSLIAASPPRMVVVAYNEPDSPAADADVARGAQILTIDGEDVANGSDVDTLNAGLFPASEGETHTFEVLDLGATESRTVMLTSAIVENAPVQGVTPLDTASGPVGYMLFNDHLAPAELALVDAVNQLKDAAITDLVIDMRYNGGGYLAIASELAFEIAGPDATAGKTFEATQFNDQYPDTDPFSGQPNEPTPFIDTTVPGIGTRDGGEALPSLDLPRVFILTGPDTCSASESVMNGLRGIDVEVVQIGETTCGKPYGFVPQDNCGTTYFSIEFQGINDKGFGDYADGFTPGGDGGAGVPGCQVADDFTHQLGDPAEARLAAALAYRDQGSCPDATESLRRAGSPLSAVDGRVLKSVWQQNRILVR